MEVTSDQRTLSGLDIIVGDYEATYSEAESICRRLRVADDPGVLISQVADKLMRAERPAEFPDVSHMVAYRRKSLENAALDIKREQTRRRRRRVFEEPEGHTLDAADVAPSQEAVCDACDVYRCLQARLSQNALSWLQVFISETSVANFARERKLTLRTAQRRFEKGRLEIRQELERIITELYGAGSWDRFLRDIGMAIRHIA
jgi:DNA-directed RNA polymerase specialized sigma24 family protein